MKTTITTEKDIVKKIFENKNHLIWVPKKYGGLGYDLSKGLKTLQNIAEHDANLAWLITLCAGANYFSRNLKPEIAIHLFSKPYTLLGGSGFIGGTAEKIGSNYLINGKWKYATGSIYLSHFTFNAKITKNGIPVLDDNGNEQIRSFVISKENVNIIKDWKSSGMQETQTHSFEIKNQTLFKDYMFEYNKFYTDSILDKVPFQVFTDLTFIVNYLGMAKQYIKLAQKEIDNLNFISILNKTTVEIEKQISIYIAEIENKLQNKSLEIESLALEIHNYGCTRLKLLAHQILDIYLDLGLLSTQSEGSLNKLFNDFFTASQHKNFKKFNLATK